MFGLPIRGQVVASLAVLTELRSTTERQLAIGRATQQQLCSVAKSRSIRYKVAEMDANNDGARRLLDDR